MSQKPLIIDPKELRPLPQALWGISCSRCDKNQANWEVCNPSHADKRRGEVVCSLCWLYDSAWGRVHQVELESMIEGVEKECGQIFERCPPTLEEPRSARLRICKDADRILAAIAVTSRMFSYHQMMEDVREPTDE